MLLLRYKSLI